MRYIGFQPPGFDPDTRQAWVPPRPAPGQPEGPPFWGQVAYPEPLTPEQVYRYELRPADPVEWAEYLFWRQGEDAEWLLSDYLSQDSKVLEHLSPTDPLAQAALVLRR